MNSDLDVKNSLISKNLKDVKNMAEKLKYLKSKDLPKIKKIKNKKKVLLINPKKIDTEFMLPHNGLATLAGVLKKRGHEVLVVDYAFLVENRDKEISFFIEMFNPDIIGISIYTPCINEANEIINKIREISNKIPIMAGGPHASIYTEELKKNKSIDYIFIGEAELTIMGVVENAKRNKIPKIIQSKEILNLYYVPFPDYKSFYGWETITSYPVMTSRGCPNKCSFCSSIGLSYRIWRPRKPEECIRELEFAKKEISENLKFVVFDDCPTVNMARFNEFLELYIEKINAELAIVNTRADSIDDKLLELLKKCNIRLLSIGVEHGNPQVFKMVNKGESLEDVKRACKLIRKHKIRLGVSFIIGLPGDNLERTKDSIELCRELKADVVSLNFLNPFKLTPAREWLEKNHAVIYDELNYGALVMQPLECPQILVETPDFTKFERQKAFYMFLFAVAEPRLKLRYLPKIISIAKKYELKSEFIHWLPHGIVTSLKNTYHILTYGIYVYKKIGFKNLIKRLLKMYKQKRINAEYLKNTEKQKESTSE